jgi:predicted metalloprotease with PDZ domain
VIAGEHLYPVEMQGANVSHSRLVSSRSALLACAAMLAGAPLTVLLADTPAPPPPPAPPALASPAPPALVPPVPAHGTGNSDLEAQLDAARRNLEQAAHDVAELSAQMSTTAIDEVKPLVEPSRAIIGVQLEPTDDGVGARVREVSPGGPAEQAGIRPGDVIVAVNGTALSGAHPARQVLGIMHGVQPDSRVTVRVLRAGKPRDFTLTARASPSLFVTTHGLPDLGFALSSLPGAFMFHRPFMDMELATLTPRLGSYFGTDKGVLVVRAPAGGALKLEDGDVILAIDGRQPSSGSHATRILGSYQPGEKVKLRIVRQHKTMELEGTLPESPDTHRDMLQQSDKSPEEPNRKVVILGNSAV